jgi:hypothetical protein
MVRRARPRAPPHVTKRLTVDTLSQWQGRGLFIAVRSVASRRIALRIEARQLATREEATVTTARYRTVWLSDTHLGTRGCQARPLVDFLDTHECEYLYLAGASSTSGA